MGGETAGPKHCGVPAGRREAGPGRDTTEQLIPGEGKGREEWGRVDLGWDGNNSYGIPWCHLGEQIAFPELFRT